MEWIKFTVGAVVIFMAAWPEAAWGEEPARGEAISNKRDSFEFAIGAKGGLGWVTEGGKDAESQFGRAIPKLGSSYGIGVSFVPMPRLGLVLELAKMSKGAGVENADGTYYGTLDHEYLGGAAIADIRILTSGMIIPYVQVGVELGYLLETFRRRPMQDPQELTEGITKLDVGVIGGVGVGVRFAQRHEITLDGRLDIGLRSIDDSGNNEELNRALLFVLGYRYWVLPRRGGKPVKAVDMDQDGVPDARDKCVDQAEDIDKFQDDDGCPDADNDSDEILDADDKCPLEAEDGDEFQDADGCPDPDNDGDGVDDEHDRCQDEMEDKNGYRDDDGCADANDDDDEDGVLDVGDKCLDKAGYWTADGCPRAYQSIAVQKAGIVFVGDARVGFVMKRRKATDTLDPAAHAVLDEVAQALVDHPTITRLDIGVHTARGGKANVKLSQKQAEAVRAYLVAKGVDEARLVATGHGNKKPLVEPDTGKRKAIDRVEITIE